MASAKGLKPWRILKKYERGILSQSEIARKLGISRQAVHYWFNKLKLKTEKELTKPKGRRKRMGSRLTS